MEAVYHQTACSMSLARLAQLRCPVVCRHRQATLDRSPALLYG
jgi:hypothetical protein